MDTEIIRGVEFINRPVYEFITVANQYTNIEEITKMMNENNIKVDESIMNVFDYIDDNLSSFIKKEIQFFGKLGSIAVCLYGFISDFEEIYTIDDYFKVFDEVCDEHLFNYIGGSFLGEYYKDDNCRWPQVKHDMTLMRQYIVDVKDIKKNMKNDILSLFDSPKETRMRLRYIIKALYQVYENLAEELEEKVRKLTEEFKEEYNRNPKKFLVEHFVYDFIDASKEKVKIQCTYTGILGCMTKRKSQDEIEVVVSTMSKDIYYKTQANDNLDKFLKLISDKTRQKIVKILSEREIYGQALAKELSLTPATVNYHLQSFLIIGLVTIREENNKAYYKLDKVAANSYIDQLKERFNL